MICTRCLDALEALWVTSLTEHTCKCGQLERQVGDVNLFLESLQKLKVAVPQLGEREQQLQHGLRAHTQISLFLLPATRTQSRPNRSCETIQL